MSGGGGGSCTVKSNLNKLEHWGEGTGPCAERACEQIEWHTDMTEIVTFATVGGQGSTTFCQKYRQGSLISFACIKPG